MTRFEIQIMEYIHHYNKPKKTALSKKYPILKKPIIFVRQLFYYIQNVCNIKIRYTKKNVFFTAIIARHQSVLRRTLGDSDPHLQEQKIINITQAIKKLNGVIIQPHHIFSLWHIIGKPRYKDGYVDGMMLSNGQVIKGIGGGLCQLSNFLYWIFLHAPTDIIERHHHSLDVFPDSGRTLPFGSGATILYNFVDLKIKNISKYPLQLKLWLTDTHLKGQIVSPHHIAEKFHIFEKNHLFIKTNKTYFRYNEIYRDMKIKNNIIHTKKITTNFAPVLYPVTYTYLQKHKYHVLDMTHNE